MGGLFGCGAGRIEHPFLSGSPFPRAEIPAGQPLAQLITLVQVEFDQQIADMSFDGIGCDAQADGNLAIGVTETDQRGNFLLARGEQLPALPGLFILAAVLQAGLNQRLQNLLRRALFLIRQLTQGLFQTGIEGKGALLLPCLLPEKVQQALPEVHIFIL